MVHAEMPEAAVIAALHRYGYLLYGAIPPFEFDPSCGWHLEGHVVKSRRVSSFDWRYNQVSADAINYALGRCLQDFQNSADDTLAVYKVTTKLGATFYVVYGKTSGVMYIYATAENILIRPVNTTWVQLDLGGADLAKE
jgi:hypothetical protein